MVKEKKIKLLIADDHVIVRDGLKMLFQRIDDIEIAAEANNGQQVLEMLERTPVDVALLDIAMPHANGPELVHVIRERFPRIPILIFSMYNEPHIALDFISAGVTGYITKDSDPAVILAAVRNVASGKRYLPPGIAEKLAFYQASSAGHFKHRELTNRETQVLRMLARGESISDIAQRLFISHKTVSSHKARIMQKISCTTNLQLMQYAIKHGLVDNSAFQPPKIF